jgi:hypothetical protein
MCPLGFLMLGSTCKTCRIDSPAACDQPAAEGEPRCAPAPTNERSSHAPGLSGSATRSSWHCPTTSRRRPGPSRRRLAQQRLRQLRPRGADSGRPPAGHGRSGRPRRPRPSQPYGCLSTPGSRTSLRPDTAHAATHRHRTPDSGHLDAQTPPPDIGQRSRGQASVDTGRSHRTPDTARWTPDAGRGRGQGDEGAATVRTSWATTPSDRTLGRPTVFLWTASAALDSPCRLGGEAAFQREIASRRQLLGRSAGVERRLGALLSSDEFRVERRANGEASSVMAVARMAGCGDGRGWSSTWRGRLRTQAATGFDER